MVDSAAKCIGRGSVGHEVVALDECQPLVAQDVDDKLAMAGAAVRPGDWMPAALMKPRRLVGPMMKSSPSATARRPANWAMTSFSLMPGTSSLHRVEDRAAPRTLWC